MRRTLKRIALALAVTVAVVLCTAAVLAWRATRVPTWYAAAVDQTPPDADADAAINRRILPLQNWLVRTSAGDLDAKPDDEKSYELELTEDEINAVLAKYFDNLHGQYQVFRARLLPGEIDLAFTWAEQGRTVTVTTAVAAAADGRPTVALGRLRLGDQGVPASWVTAVAAKPVRTRLQSYAGRVTVPRIDEHDAASGRTVELYYARLLLDVLNGRAVSPDAFLPLQVSGDAWVATRVTKLDVGDRKMAVTFRLLTAAEREAVVASLSTPLPDPPPSD